MDGNGMTGFNPSNVIAAINGFEEGYKELNNALYKGLQTNFVEEMQNYWASEQAQRFFKTVYLPAINELYTAVENSCASITSTLNSAATDQARQAESNWTPMDHTAVPNPASVDCIKADLDGNKGINIDRATEVESHLDTIQSQTESALEVCAQKLSNSGFIDPESSQQSRINESLNQIKSDTTDFVTKIKNGLKTNIDDTIAQYGALKAANESSFTAQ